MTVTDRSRFKTGSAAGSSLALLVKGETANLYGIRTVPTPLLVDPDGRLVGDRTLEGFVVMLGR